MEVLAGIIENQKRFLEGRGVKYLEKYPDYTERVEDNLVVEMSQEALTQYGAGSGGELDAKDGKPAKMASVRSSSAMTFNLLGNSPVEIIGDDVIPAGMYDVTYEKQLWTLGYKGQPANLDAFLRCGSTGVFCEMKMTEWLRKTPFTMHEKYDLQENWFFDSADEVFHAILEDLKRHDYAFGRYDAAQMFKHTLGIYNNTTKEKADRFGEPVTNVGLAGSLDHIVLANVVYQIEEGELPDLRAQHSYERMEKEEREGFEALREIMLDPKYGLQELFRKNSGASFDLIYRSAGDFAALQGKAAKGSALERYWKIKEA